MHFVNANGEKYTPNNYLTFDDVLLKPQKSIYNSRNDPRISLACAFGNIPFISANMDTVTDYNMAVAMDGLGGLGILHRFHKDDSVYRDIILKTAAQVSRLGFSIGCGTKWIDFTKDIIDRLRPIYDKQVCLCLDVAHGHMQQSINTVEELARNFDVHIIAGNVATVEGAIELAEAGADTVKVGIGSGSLCTTRIVTGHGVPQLSAIIAIREAFDMQDIGCNIIADGGIRNSGDIVKALAAGADGVMIGSLFAGCDESPGDVHETSNGAYKMYRGQSSAHFMKDIGKKGVASEGEATYIKVKGSVTDVVSELLGGLRSGMTYSGCGTIRELQDNAVFIEISHHGYVESTPHALHRYK